MTDVAAPQAGHPQTAREAENARQVGQAGTVTGTGTIIDNPNPNVPSLTGENTNSPGGPGGPAEYLTEDIFSNQTAFDEQKNALAAAYGKRIGAPTAALDPATITMIFEAAMMMIKKCMEARAARAAAAPPAAIADQYIREARQRGFITRFVVSSNVRDFLRERHGPFAYHRHNGEAITDAILDAGGTATQDKVIPMIKLALAM